MNYHKEMERLLLEQKEIALATSLNNIPNVRIVNFIIYKTNKGVIYFSSFKDNEKVSEFKKNEKVSFTTIPHRGNEHLRVHQGRVKKSHLTVFDLKQDFIKKLSDYGELIDHAGDQLILFEVHFNKINVTLDMEHSKTITL